MLWGEGDLRRHLYFHYGCRVEVPLLAGSPQGSDSPAYIYSALPPLTIKSFSSHSFSSGCSTAEKMVLSSLLTLLFGLLALGANAFYLGNPSLFDRDLSMSEGEDGVGGSLDLLTGHDDLLGRTIDKRQRCLPGTST